MWLTVSIWWCLCLTRHILLWISENVLFRVCKFESAVSVRMWISQGCVHGSVSVVGVSVCACENV